MGKEDNDDYQCKKEEGHLYSNWMMTIIVLQREREREREREEINSTVRIRDSLRERRDIVVSQKWAHWWLGHRNSGSDTIHNIIVMSHIIIVCDIMGYICMLYVICTLQCM